MGNIHGRPGGSFVDFFLGFKRGALILLGAVIIILFCAAQWMRVQAKAVWTTKNQKIVLILLAVFGGVTAISALLADEKIDALFGGFEQMEGLLVVTAYVALFCLAYFLLSSENKIQVIVHAAINWVADSFCFRGVTGFWCGLSGK